MSQVFEPIFLAAVLLIVYTWSLYPVALFLASRFFNGKKEETGPVLPAVTLLVTVRNEEGCIEDKIKNCLAIDYPREKFEILIASDGSMDRTDQIVLNYAAKGVRLFRLDKNEGKTNAQNRAVMAAKGEVIVLTDADTVLERDFIRKIVRPFNDPETGCVTGRCEYLKGPGSVNSGLGFFWRYELLLRGLENRLGLLFTATGACMAFRKGLFREIPKDEGDDCAIPYDVLLRGAKTVYEERAVAYVRNPNEYTAEFRARIRMVIRNLVSTLRHGELINFFRHPFYAWAIWSHKILRWMTPVFMLLVLISNVALLGKEGAFYKTFFFLQAFFYSLALIGYYLERSSVHIRLFSLPFSFCVANTAFLLGLVKTFAGTRIKAYR